MHAEGQGMKQDLVMAYVWFNLAASQGVGVALENVEPFLETKPNLRRGMPKHKHPQQAAPAAHP